MQLWVANKACAAIIISIRTDGAEAKLKQLCWLTKELCLLGSQYVMIEGDGVNVIESIQSSI